MDKKIEHALEIYKDISRQIQFADTKAGLILAWHGASLFFFFKIIFSIEMHFDNWHWLLLALVLFFVGSSILQSFFTILPRLTTDYHNQKCMFWIFDITKGTEDFTTAKTRFMTNIESNEQVFECITNSVIAISNVLKIKYKKIQIALGGLIAGLIFEIVLLLCLLYEKQFSCYC